MRDMHTRSALPHRLEAACFVLAAALCWPGGASGAPTAFRFQDMDTRDPHYFITVIGCNDVTDNTLFGFAMNEQTQTNLTTDGDGNGFLDLSYLVVFDPLDPAAAGGTLRFGRADCTAPVGSATCAPGAEALRSVAYANGSSGSCLAPIAGTTHGYSPAVASPGAPCFVTEPFDYTLDLFGVPIPLHGMRIAASYVGEPPTQLANGLLAGFLTEADADATILPASLALIGGLPLSSLLPGGNPPGIGLHSCSNFDDRDFDAGVRGWWFYINFPAVMAPFDDPTSSVESSPSTLVRVGAAHPNPTTGSLSVAYSLGVPATVRITVLDAMGRKIARPFTGVQSPGPHSVTWDGLDERGVPSATGAYQVVVEALGRSTSRRVVLLR